MTSHEAPESAFAAADLTDDAVLGGRLRLLQPRRGHRVGHDAILLAAATGAEGGQTAIDLGAGVGAAGLALAARVPGLSVTLVEIDPALTALAADNTRRNGLADRVRAVTLDVTGPADAFAQAGLAPESADRVLMNPPFNDLARHRGSPDPDRRRAHAAAGDELSAWLATAARLLRRRGVVTVILRADRIEDVLRGFDPHFGGVVLLPVHGTDRAPAIRIIARAVKGSRAPLQLLSGCVLERDGRPTTLAEAVLRDLAVLPLEV
ncbi:MAG TPA: methyltransferase [Xanthobacteraceae bacterium]|nr:methyltransferase [Xanthobacteraceae bacterium]